MKGRGQKSAISVMSALQIIEYLEDFFDQGDDPDFALQRLKTFNPKGVLNGSAKTVKMKIVACCVAKTEPSWNGSMPFVWHDDPLTVAPPRKSIARVLYISNLRNQVVKKAIDAMPDVTHILMVDSWFIEHNHFDKFKAFAESYDIPNAIVGASTWAMREWPYFFIPKEKTFCEVGVTPEAMDATHLTEGKTGRIRVNAVGAVYIFPIEAWLVNGYGTRTDYFWPEHHQLCKGFECYLDFDHEFYQPWREHFNWKKKVRMTVGSIKWTIAKQF